MQDLTQRQEEILALIRDVVAQTGTPPTRAEIASHFGFRSANAAEGHLRALAKKGVIELRDGTSRGIRLCTTKAQGIPLIGRVAAGAPILAEACIEDYFVIDPRLFRPSPDYLLRVHGMSMKNAGIVDGDLLAVQHCPVAEHGQIVVARLEGEVTVKRFHRKGRSIWLMPENEAFEPIKVPSGATDFCIEGMAVGVIRSGVG